tara:strand:- start:60 stop:1991 length:1932 start_codon:yes stop_codon:yes gene_type:complete
MTDPITQSMMQGAAGAAGGATYIDDVFKVDAWQGDNDNNRNIVNGIDLAGEGGMVIIKQRNGSNPWFVTDTERGATKTLRMASNNGESTDATALKVFNNNGFTIGSDGATNAGTTQKYFSNTFRRAKGFFDVVKYTGTGSTQSIAHNLGSTPGAMIVKRYDGSEDWDMLHMYNGGQAYYMQINGSTSARLPDSSGELWGGQNPTATHFTVGGHGRTNFSGWEYIAYLFADDDQIFGENEDQSIIKCGTFNTDGSGNATVNLGWEPDWLMVKRYDSSSSWSIWDTRRGWEFDDNYDYIQWNSNDAEQGNANYGWPYAEGFTNNGNMGANANVMYIAVRRPDPLVAKPPQSGNDVFKVQAGTGNAATSTFPTTFSVDFTMARDTSSDNWQWSNRLTGFRALQSNTANTASGNGNHRFDYSTGSWQAYSSPNYGWSWKRYAGFDVVAYTGNGANPQILKHNLTQPPQMMIVKSMTNSANWKVYHYGANGGVDAETKYWRLNHSDGWVNGYNMWSSFTPTATHFRVGDSAVNGNGGRYIAYLFASVDGISKVGWYTGNGTGQTITTGFQPRFVMIKKSPHTSPYRDWFILDTARGWGAGNDNYLAWNTNTQELSYDFGAPTSTGFTLTASGDGYNGDTIDYIYYAHA